jgi:hypothetical protein
VRESDKERKGETKREKEKEKKKAKQKKKENEKEREREGGREREREIGFNLLSVSGKKYVFNLAMNEFFPGCGALLLISGGKSASSSSHLLLLSPRTSRASFARRITSCRCSLLSKKSGEGFTKMA